MVTVDLNHLARLIMQHGLTKAMKELNREQRKSEKPKPKTFQKPPHRHIQLAHFKSRTAWTVCKWMEERNSWWCPVCKCRVGPSNSYFRPNSFSHKWLLRPSRDPEKVDPRGPAISNPGWRREYCNGSKLPELDQIEWQGEHDEISEAMRFTMQMDHEEVEVDRLPEYDPEWVENWRYTILGEGSSFNEYRSRYITKQVLKEWRMARLDEFIGLKGLL